MMQAWNYLIVAINISWFWLIKKQELFGVYKYKAQLRKTTLSLKNQ